MKPRLLKSSSAKKLKVKKAKIAKLKKCRPISTKYYLADPKNRIKMNFKVHPQLKPRVSFWFNIYTKYSSKHHIIHHSLHPWIVFDVIDTSDLYNKYSDHRIADIQAEVRAKNRKKEIRAILKKIASQKNFKNLNKEENRIFKKIKFLGKNYKHILAVAQKNIRSQSGQNDFFGQGVHEKHKYLSHIKPILSQHGVPEELAALPLVESSFNIKARSKVGASGIWQIMPPTGKQYGIIDKNIDERNSPLKATVIAAKLLKFNYKILKNWPLAITAYNNGIGNIRKTIKKAGTNNPYRLINGHKQGAFGFASANFYASFIAALYASKYSDHIFKTKKALPLKFDAVALKNKMSLRQLVKVTGLSLQTLKKYNLDLKKKVGLNTWLPRKFKIFLPVGNGNKFSPKNVVILNAKSNRFSKKKKSPRS